MKKRTVVRACVAVMVAVATANCATIGNLAERHPGFSTGRLDANGEFSLLYEGKTVADFRKFECRISGNGFQPDVDLPCYGRDTEKGMVLYVLGPSGKSFSYRVLPK